VNDAFKKMLEAGKIGVKDDATRARWIQLHQIILENFMMPMLASDIRRIISGDGDRMLQMYNEIKQEILTLSHDSSAEKWENINNESHPINHKRLNEIRAAYKDLNGRELVAGDISQFHLSNRKETDYHRPLMMAIEHWLVEKEIDMNGMSDLLSYFTRKDVDRKTQALGQSVENSFERLGYNRQSFVEALKLFYDLRYTKAKRAEQKEH
jgi:hypothetical protein